MKFKTAWMYALALLVGISFGSTVQADSPDAIFKAMIKTAEEDRADHVWNALPSSYRSEINGLVKSFAENMDADIYNKTMVIFGKLGKTLKEKRDFIFANPMVGMMAMQSPIPMEEVKKNVGSFADTMQSIANSDLKSLDTMKSMDVGKLFSNELKSLPSMIDQWAKEAEGKSVRESMKNTKITVVSQDGDSAKVRVDPPDEEAQEFDMMKVDGVWVPKEFHEEFTKGIAEAKGNMANLKIPADQKPMAMGMMGMAENVLDQMLAAQTQAEFDQAVNGIMQMLGPMMGGGGMGGGMGGR